MDVVKRVRSEMTGRIADEQNNVMYLLEIVKRAGNGNYLEIGVLHGGTLCAAGLWKQELNQRGQCVGIDPLDGYYMDYIDTPKRGCKVDPITRLPVAEDIVKENIKKFGLSRRCKIIKSKSNPLPDKAAGMEFSVTYIDGDHWGDAPYVDFENVKDITTGYIIFDNYDEKHPDVMGACHRAAEDPAWDKFFCAGITYALRRVDV